MLVALGGAPVAATPSEADQFGPQTTALDQMLGRWEMVGERCEDGETPSAKHLSVILSLESDFRYELSVEGWRSVGTYRVDRFRDSPLRVRLADTLYDFDLVDGRLENWGEGDAAYLCGRIFERTR